jgi:hypothetical protein
MSKVPECAFANCAARYIDLLHRQIRKMVEQVDNEEIDSARNAIAAVVSLGGICPTFSNAEGAALFRPVPAFRTQRELAPAPIG